jgi:hypothetical protein
MMKIVIQHKNHEWVKLAYTFEHGIKIAESLQNRLGLIGRTYIISECGKTAWIR